MRICWDCKDRLVDRNNYFVAGTWEICRILSTSHWGRTCLMLCSSNRFSEQRVIVRTRDDWALEV